MHKVCSLRQNFAEALPNEKSVNFLYFIFSNNVIIYLHIFGFSVLPKI